MQGLASSMFKQDLAIGLVSTCKILQDDFLPTFSKIILQDPTRLMVSKIWQDDLTWSYKINGKQDLARWSYMILQDLWKITEMSNWPHSVSWFLELQLTNWNGNCSCNSPVEKMMNWNGNCVFRKMDNSHLIHNQFYTNSICFY